MRKLFVLVLAIVVIPIVEAVKILGQEISMVVLVPIVLILIFLIVFIAMIIRDKRKNKQQVPDIPDALGPLPEEGLGDNLGEDLSMAEDSLDLGAAPKIEKKVQEAKTDYFKELEVIKGNLTKENTLETNKKVNELIKKFFTEYSKIKYKFTFEELDKELKKNDNKVICFSDNLNMINYSPKEVTYDELVQLINEFRDIIEATTEEEQLAVPKFKKELEEKKKKINMLLKKGEKLINRDVMQAREDYKEILKIYDTLISREKEAIRPAIMDFYNKLNS